MMVDIPNRCLSEEEGGMLFSVVAWGTGLLRHRPTITMRFATLGHVDQGGP
jgi:hypothetical protein